MTKIIVQFIVLFFILKLLFVYHLKVFTFINNLGLLCFGYTYEIETFFESYVPS